MSNITTLIPTSPIPSHPSTAILDETISNIRKYTDGKIIIMMDGVPELLSHRREDYDKYTGNVLNKATKGEYGDCECKIFISHTHQSEMTRVVLKEMVTTPLIMFIEHDCSPIGEIPFEQICNMVEHSSIINYIRFNIFHKILDEHQYLMLNPSPIEIDGVRLVRTIQFSARPNIAKANWYRDILFTYFRGSREMIEDRMHSIVIEKYKELGYDSFGLAIYTPDTETQLRSYHSDGRGTDTKIIEA